MYTQKRTLNIIIYIHQKAKQIFLQEVFLPDSSAGQSAWPDAGKSAGQDLDLYFHDTFLIL